ncbi:MAG TPA: ABC transporter ATP-binding protein [Clostridia bacterium]|nr:ABC transporter ATP-binding protein [Clostridia bacterium]
MNGIDIENITKYYGNLCVLDDISLKILPNKIYGLLGRNGAGKTTLLNLMTNRIFPTSGEIRIGGERINEKDEAPGKAYYMTEQDLWPEGMTIKRVFKWTGEFYSHFDMEYALSLCDKFELKPGKKVKDLSTGYTTIAKLIATLASNADILIFDEPILGLDANHRDMFYKELIDSYIERPKTIILSTHIIGEISHILERVIIIKDKKIAVDESVEDLIKDAYSIAGSKEKVEQFIAERKCVHKDIMAGFMSATVVGELTDEDRKSLAKNNIDIGKVELQKLFIHLTQRGGGKQ